MKRLIVALVVLIALLAIPFTTSAQSAEGYLKEGISSLDMADDFLFILYDEEAAFASLEYAMLCFNTAIELNPEYAEAYY
jgi:hypothetical protein